MSTTMILLLGACCVVLLVLVGAVVNSPDPTEPRRPRGYQGQHGTVSDVAAWTTQAPRLAARRLEEQLVSFPVGHPERARPVDFYGVQRWPLGTKAIDMALYAVEQAHQAAAQEKQERTEEQPVVEPVEHVGAVEGWSPKDELPAAAPLDPERTEVRRAAGRHRRLARTVSPDRIADRRIDAAHTELDATLAPLLKRLERAGHADTDTWQWTPEELAELLADRGGAVR